MSIASGTIKERARALGFDLVGVAPAVLPPEPLSFFERWLAGGFDASMAWIARGKEKRADIQKVLPGAKSVVSCGLSYYRGHPLSIESEKEGHGWISNYAWGEDYHDVVLKKLEQLEAFIRQRNPQAETRSYVDTGPILERAYAAQAGLGWIGKNTCLINRHQGSFFFIGEIITDLELEFDKPDADHCGKCTRCMDACPTQALTPYHLDANRCVSYLTIEHRGEIATELQADMGHHLVGCDICQDVCPWNRDIPVSKESAFDPRPGNFRPDLAALTRISAEEFPKRFQKSPIKRLKWEGLARNARIAGGRSSKDGAQDP